jgi:hypothetical protein
MSRDLLRLRGIAGNSSCSHYDQLQTGCALTRTYWYAWTPPTDLLGITMFNGTLAATAYQTTHDWVNLLSSKSMSIKIFESMAVVIMRSAQAYSSHARTGRSSRIISSVLRPSASTPINCDQFTLERFFLTTHSWPRTSNSNGSPGSMPRASRTCLGMVICPLLDTVPATSTE